MKTICLDFDGVLAYYTEWDGTIGEPNPEGVKLAQMLHDEGFKIVIQSCRWHSNWGDSGQAIQDVRDWLKMHEIPYDELELGDKAFAAIYVDDRAIPFNPNIGPADEVFNKIKDRLSMEESND